MSSMSKSHTSRIEFLSIQLELKLARFVLSKVRLAAVQVPPLLRLTQDKNQAKRGTHLSIIIVILRGSTLSIG